MSNEIALSRPAALHVLRSAGLDPDTAQDVLATVRVAARWNGGFGRCPYYYPKDLNAAVAARTKD